MGQVVNGRRNNVIGASLARRSNSSIGPLNASTESLDNENADDSSGGNEFEGSPCFITDPKLSGGSRRQRHFYQRKASQSSTGLYKSTSFPNSAKLATENFIAVENKPQKSKVGSQNDMVGINLYQMQRKETSTVIQARNALMWTEVAYRIDFITFVVCTSLAIFIPIGLFLPLSIVNAECSDNYKDFNKHGPVTNEYHDH